MSKSDLFRRLFTDPSDEHTELSDYISSGVDQIIRGKFDPYYTIVKTKIKDYYLWSDTQIDEEYKTKMVERLNRMYFRAAGIIPDTFEKNFLEICLEYVKENNTAISKSALSYLNELNKGLPK